MNIVVFLALLVACCGYAACFGGAPERVAAAIMMVAVAATATVGQIHFRQFSTPEMGLALVDAAAFAAFVTLTLKADRFWPIGVAACIGVGLLMQAAVWMRPSTVPSVYATFHAFSAYPALMILAIGTFRHRRRLKATGTDRSWSHSSG